MVLQASNFEKVTTPSNLGSETDLLSFHEQNSGRLVMDPQYVYDAWRLFASVLTFSTERRWQNSEKILHPDSS